jgi:hypothetical protein
MLGSGDLSDYSLNGNHGTNNGATWVAGDNGPALSFDGTTLSAVALNKAVVLRSNFTIIMKLKWNAVGSRLFTSSDYDGNQNPYGFQVFEFADEIHTKLQTGEFSSESKSISSPTRTLSKAVTLAFVKIGTLGSWYWDGELLGTDNTFGVNSYLPIDRLSGFSDGSGFDLDGSIHNACVYDRALSAEEIKQQYDNPWVAWQKDDIALLAATQGVPPATGFEPWFAVNNNNLIGVA